MSSSTLDNLINNIDVLKKQIYKIKNEANLEFLSNLLQNENLIRKNDPSNFYNLLNSYKDKSTFIKDNFFTELEQLKKFDQFGETINYYLDPENINYPIKYDCDDSGYCSGDDILQNVEFTDNSIHFEAINKKKIMVFKYGILKNNIEILRTFLKAEKQSLNATLTDIKNNTHLSHTLNDDYSEIFKYKYLRNWGIFLSIVVGSLILKKLKNEIV
jgi:hypothetical protein